LFLTSNSQVTRCKPTAFSWVKSIVFIYDVFIMEMRKTGYYRVALPRPSVRRFSCNNSRTTERTFKMNCFGTGGWGVRELYLKSVDKFQFCLRSDNSDGHFTWIPSCVSARNLSVTRTHLLQPRKIDRIFGANAVEKGETYLMLNYTQVLLSSR
jgi:hypothetical protein